MENDLLKDMSSPQAEAIGELDRNLQIIACAGSGKTTVITKRIANILRNKPDVSYEDIVAFTFTDKAAESLKKRTADVLGVAPDDLEGMYVGTIHSFAAISFGHIPALAIIRFWMTQLIIYLLKDITKSADFQILILSVISIALTCSLHVLRN